MPLDATTIDSLIVIAACFSHKVEDLLKLHPGAGLHVTGHSMGAAVAEICALEAKLKFGINRVSHRVNNIKMLKASS